MRICPMCGSEMKEGYDIKLQSAGYGVVITEGEGVFARRLGKPKVAVCPKCGEVSVYIEDVEKLSGK